MDTLSKFTTPGIVFLLTLVFGVWLSLVGRPYNGTLFNIHKLIALGAVVVTGMQLFKVLKDTGIRVAPILHIVVAVACAIALFATGALVSLEKLNYKVMLTIHRIAPIWKSLYFLIRIQYVPGRKMDKRPLAPDIRMG